MSKGKIIMFIGPMFSGKSSALIAEARKLEVSKKPFVVIRYAKDTRYSKSEIVSHNKDKYTTTFTTEKLSDLKIDDNVRAVLIDEGQFFKDLVHFCETHANGGKVVMVSGLNGTFNRTGFEPMSELYPKAEEIHKFHAICQVCGEIGDFTKILIASDQQVVIGGSDIYEARCRECFQK